jgi:hypothetical protein
MIRTSEPTGSSDIHSGDRIDEDLHADSRHGSDRGLHTSNYRRRRIPGMVLRHAVPRSKASAVRTLSVTVIQTALIAGLVRSPRDANRGSPRLARTAR